jgi:1,4-alpha-glucan branching enzyme
MNTGYLILLLHAHLPFVRHPEHESFLEETWLFEAISETYLPLLRVLDSLENDQVPFRLVLSVSPTLITMLQDDLLQERYVRYAERTLELADRELSRTRDKPKLNRLAQMYRTLHEQNLQDFADKYERDLVKGFDYHYKRGKLELMATAATHAYLPLYVQHPPAVRAQVQIGVETHAKVFGKAAKGFWLPEMGYAPGLEDYLLDQGISHTVVATHGLVFAEQPPAAGVYEPTLCPNGLAVFGRDHGSSNAVWSAEDGYPGDISYRDFYRDIGHDMPLDYIGPYLPEGHIRMNTGFKYHAITGKTDQKALYDPDVAARKVQEHADNFLYNLQKRSERLSDLMEIPPVVTCPFDAELFGHWWFEGPQWLEAVIRKIAASEHLSLITPTEYLKDYPDHQVSTPAFSSWGTKGYSEVWMDGSNDWVHRHTHKAIERMAELIERYPSETGLRQRALNQAAREVLLSQASDWPFIMRAGTAVPYAVSRVKDHVANVAHVYEALRKGAIGTEWLTRVERQHNIFPDLDYRVFCWSEKSSVFSVPAPSVPQ